MTSESVKELSNDELRTRLLEVGENVGPITDAVRRLYERKLQRLMTGTTGDEDGNENHRIETESVSLRSSHESQKNPDCKIEDTAPKSASPEGDTSLCLFAVSVPTDTEVEKVFEQPESRIFSDKVEALKVVKKIKGSRFKQFRELGEAATFAATAADLICPPSPVCKNPCSPTSLVQPLPAPAEGSAFKGPKIQELVRLRKAIEKNDIEAVKSLVWTNPRYLVSSGDTPTLLQEGFRYNSLHVSAMKNKPEICKFLVDTLEDVKFFQMLYPQDSHKTTLQRIHFLMDLYLNMPDKGNNETPLHFACKFGNAAVVEILVAHPRTDRFVRNKNGEIPKEITCTRAGDESTRRKIEELLEGLCFVPLLRSEDNSTQAVIGEPWSPKISSDQSDRRIQSSGNPCEPALNVKAYAGPMTPSQASKFRHEWITPPDGGKELKQIRCTDSDKGLERIGRDLAHAMDVPWSEYWVFLDTFVDFTSDSGLERLEAYLAQKDPHWKPAVTRKVVSDELEQISQSDVENINNNNDSSLDNLLSSLTAFKLNDSDRSREGDKLLPNFNQSFNGDNSMKSNFYNTENSFLSSSPEGSDEEYITAEEDSDPEDSFSRKQARKKILVSNRREQEPFSSHIVQLEKRLNQLDCSEPTRSKEQFSSLGSTPGSWRFRQEGINTSAKSVNELDQSVSNSTTSGDSVETYDSTEHIFRYKQYRDTPAHTALSSPDEKSLSDLSDSSLLSPPGGQIFPSLSHNSPLPATVKGFAPKFSTPVARSKNIFIKGDHPTKLDIDVLRSLENKALNADKYPHILRWRNLVSSYSEQDRISWPSPTANKLLSRKLNMQMRNPWLLTQPTFSPLATSSLPNSSVSRSPLFRPTQFLFSPREDTEEASSTSKLNFNDSLNYI